MTQNRAQKKAARTVQEKLDIPYTMALRLVRSITPTLTIDGLVEVCRKKLEEERR